MNQKDLVISIVKDRTLPFPNTPRPYNNLAIYGGESKLHVTKSISSKVKRSTFYNKGKNGNECFDKKKEIQVNIARDYKWKSRFY